MVITDYYTGAINDVIYMIVRDVGHVMVSILSAEGKEVEKGPAVNSSGVWSYRTAVANPAFRDGRGGEPEICRGISRRWELLFFDALIMDRFETFGHPGRFST